MRAVIIACLIVLTGLLLASSSDGQTVDLTTDAGVPRLVKKSPDAGPRSADISLDDFEFQAMTLSRYGPTPWAIEGEPSKGARYYTRARLYGAEAIATAKFEAIDERGAFIAPVPIRRHSEPNGGSDFFGLLVVPDRPFRILVKGETIDGDHYERVFERLFRPVDGPAVQPFIAEIKSPTEAKRMSKLLEERMQKELAELEAEISNMPGGMIVIPRTRVFNVMFQPLFSRAGRPRGFRISYDAEFSHSGYYNPELHVFPAYEKEEWRGSVEMTVLDSNIIPAPQETDSSPLPSNPLSYGAGYMYLGKTTYHFYADMVPDFVIPNETKTKFCLFNQKHKHNPPSAQRTWRAILASMAPTTYQVYIDNSDFGGVIEKSYSVGTFYNTFLRDGARDCGPQPTSRF